MNRIKWESPKIWPLIRRGFKSSLILSLQGNETLFVVRWLCYVSVVLRTDLFGAKCLEGQGSGRWSVPLVKEFWKFNDCNVQCANSDIIASLVQIIFVKSGFHGMILGYVRWMRQQDSSQVQPGKKSWLFSIRCGTEEACFLYRVLLQHYLLCHSELRNLCLKCSEDGPSPPIVLKSSKRITPRYGPSSLPRSTSRETVVLV